MSKISRLWQLAFVAVIIVGAIGLGSSSRALAQDGDDFFIFMPSAMKNYVYIPEGVIVRSSSDFIAASSYLYIVGEVLNNTPTNARFVFLTANLYDAGGTQVYTTAPNPLTIFVGILTPQMKSPFRIIIQNPPAYTRYEVTVTWDDTTAAPFLLQTSNVSTHWDNIFNAYHVTGDAYHQGTGNLTNVDAAVTLYDAAGNVIGVGVDDTEPDDLSPGQTATFDVELSFWDGMPDRTVIHSYVLQVYDD